MYGYNFGSYGYGVGISTSLAQALIDYRDWNTTTSSEYVTDGVELVTDMFSWTNTDGTEVISDNEIFLYGASPSDTIKGQFYLRPTQGQLSEYLETNTRYKISFEYKCSGDESTYPAIKDGTGVTISTFGAKLNTDWELFEAYVSFSVATSAYIYSYDNGNEYTAWRNLSIQKVIQEPNKRYITDEGKSPKYPLALNSGSGINFNGVDQKIGTFVIPPTAVSMLYIKNGVNYYTTTLINFSLTVPVGTYKDVYYFNRTLTQAEIDNNKNQPEQFFIDAKNDASCVLAMPMNESSTGAYKGHVIDYKNYSEGMQLYTNNFFDTNLSGWLGTTYLSYNNGGVEFDNTRNDEAYQNVGVIGKTYRVRISIKSITTGIIKVRFGSTSSTSVTTNGIYEFVGTQSSHTYISISGTLTDAIVDYAECYEITSGIYPITNYTTASRTSALNIPYGLQNSKLVRDTNGVTSGISSNLEFSGNSIAIIPFMESRTVNVTLTVYPTSNTGNILSGGVVLSASGLIINQDNIITLNNKTINSTVTIGSGFVGTIKEYKETLI